MNFKSIIYVAGHNGLVGSAIVRELKKKGFKKIIVASRKQLDLTDQGKVLKFLKKKKPDFIIIAAAKVGGIYSNNKYKAEFIYENLMIQTNIIHSAFLCKIDNLIFLGSSCIYPKNCLQPIKEDYLLTSELEYTNEPYAIAKINGLKLCENYSNQYNLNYKCLMPTNVFGHNDNFDLTTSHFLPAIIRKVSDAIILDKKYVLLWGNGKPKRELIFSEDLARACVFFLGKKTKENLINIGSGYEKTIFQYTNFLIKNFCPGLKIRFIKKNLNGTARKTLNSNIAKKYKWKTIYNIENELKNVFIKFHKKNILNFK